MKKITIKQITQAHQIGSIMIDLAEKETNDQRFVNLIRLGNRLITVGEPWGFDLKLLTAEDRALIAQVNSQIKC
jgi:hypothetical protein